MTFVSLLSAFVDIVHTRDDVPLFFLRGCEDCANADRHFLCIAKELNASVRRTLLNHERTCRWLYFSSLVFSVHA